MLKTLKKFFAFCGADNRRLFMTSIWLGVISAICSAFVNISLKKICF